MKFPTQQDSWTDTTRNMTPFWPAAIGGILVSLEVDDGVQLREGRVGAGVGLSLQIPHRHLAIVVPRQQVPAAPVPTSTPSQHTDTTVTDTLPLWFPNSRYRLLLYPHQHGQHTDTTVTDTLPLWFPNSRYRLLLYPHQHGWHTDTTVTDTLPLWFPDSRYWLLLYLHQRQVSTQAYSHLHLAVAVPQQRVPASHVPASTSNQHMGTLFTQYRLFLYPHQHGQHIVPNTLSLCFPDSRYRLFLYPHQHGQHIVTNTLSLWFPDSRYRLFLYPHQHGQHIVTNTLSLWFPDSQYRLFLYGHYCQVRSWTPQSPEPCCCASLTAGTGCSCTHIKLAHRHTVTYV